MNQKLNQLLQDCRDFFSFIGSLYGICATTTSLFPLFGEVTKLVPMPPYHPRLFSLVATLLCLFVTLSTYVHRDQRYIPVAEHSWKNFFRGLASLLLYTLVVPFLIQEFEIQRGLIRLCVDVLKILTYWGTFGFFTWAFVTLAVTEYNKRAR